MATCPNFLTGKPQTDLARAVMYMAAIAAGGTATIEAVAANGNPPIPRIPSGAPVAGFADAFQIGASGASETKIHAELPYNPRRLAAMNGNVRASIIIVSPAAAPFTGTPSTIEPATPSPNLETTLYDQAVLAGYVPRTVIRPDGKPRIVIDATIGKSLTSLLSGGGGGTVGYPT